MDNSLTKYFAGELTSEEKEKLLIRVYTDIELKQAFFENQHLMALLSLLPQDGDQEIARLKFAELMQKTKNK